jgi:hypothetical protein
LINCVCWELVSSSVWRNLGERGLWNVVRSTVVCIRAVGSMGIVRDPFSHTGMRVVTSCWESSDVTRVGGSVNISTWGISISTGAEGLVWAKGG